MGRQDFFFTSEHRLPLHLGSYEAGFLDSSREASTAKVTGIVTSPKAKKWLFSGFWWRGVLLKAQTEGQSQLDKIRKRKFQFQENKGLESITDVYT